MHSCCFYKLTDEITVCAKQMPPIELNRLRNNKMLDGIDVKHRHPAVFTVDKLIHSQFSPQFSFRYLQFLYHSHSKCVKYIKVYISSHHIQTKCTFPPWRTCVQLLLLLLLLVVVELWELNLRICNCVLVETGISVGPVIYIYIWMFLKRHQGCIYFIINTVKIVK